MKHWRVVAVVSGIGLVGLGAAWSPLASGAAEPAPPVEHLNEDPATTAPYSDAVRVGSTLYLAGNLGLDQSGNLVPGGITAEAEQTMENLKHVVEHNGSSMDRVAACEVMLADIAERGAFNEVYQRYWAQGHFPARHAFGTTGLYAGARVEVSCVAIVK